MMSGPNMRFQLNLEILTGSTGEGLSLPEITEMKGPLKHFTYAADSDIKYVLTSLIVDSQNKKAFSRMDSSVSPPGFTRLKFNLDWMKQRKTGTARFTEARERQVLASPADFINNDGFVIRRKITGILRKEMKEHVHSIDNEIRQMNLAKGTIPKISFSQHGPAITANMVDPVSKMVASKDYVLALPCPRWPPEAQEWLLRNRVWPSKKQVRTIMKHGCHIVPKKHHTSKDPCEFIISFSVTEKYVAHCLSINQKRVYMLLKLLFKSCINKTHQGLTTYHLKTTLFRLCERIPQHKWMEQNPAECLEWLLLDLENYLKDRRLPHYFIPECNLLDHMTLLSAACISRNIQKVRANLAQEILKSTEMLRFSWLSRDLSLYDLILPILCRTNVTWHMLQASTLSFVSELLRKGEMHVVISILCGTTNCEILPQTEEIIEQLMTIVSSCIRDENVLSIQGLLAMLYHQRAMECSKDTISSQYRQNIGKSFDLFDICLKKTETPLWVFGCYYNLLSTQDMHTKLVRHFIANLHKTGSAINLYEEGAYTTISNHNWQTSDEKFISEMESGEFQVQTIAYIFYKVIKSAMTIAENCSGFQSKRMVMLADKVWHDFDHWTKIKSAMYPEKIDESIFLLLGLCSIIKDEKRRAEMYFQTAANCGGILSVSSDMVVYPVTLIDKMRYATKESIQAHPYRTGLQAKRNGCSCGHIKMPELVYKRCKVSVLPFTHW